MTDKHPPGGDEMPLPVYTSLEEWVHDKLVPMYRRRGARWCPKWYLHEEAIERLQVMWEKWEEAVVTREWNEWWLYVCDPHMAVLTSGDGPFVSCSEKAHKKLDTFPLADPDPLRWRGSKFADPVPAH